MKCRVDWCQRERVRDALYCREHLNDAWANRLPTFEPEWVRRAKANRLPPKVAA